MLNVGWLLTEKGGKMMDSCYGYQFWEVYIVRFAAVFIFPWKTFPDCSRVCRKWLILIAFKYVSFDIPPEIIMISCFRIYLLRLLWLHVLGYTSEIIMTSYFRIHLWNCLYSWFSIHLKLPSSLRIHLLLVNVCTLVTWEIIMTSWFRIHLWDCLCSWFSIHLRLSSYLRIHALLVNVCIFVTLEIIVTSCFRIHLWDCLCSWFSIHLRLYSCLRIHALLVTVCTCTLVTTNIAAVPHNVDTITTLWQNGLLHGHL